MFLMLLIIAVVPGNAAKMTISVQDSCKAERPGVGVVRDALEYFRGLSHGERKMRVKEMKKNLKTLEADKRAGKDVDSNLILQVVLGIFLPPLGVYLHEGKTSNKFWISVLLTVLGLLIFSFAGILLIGTLPSIIYALIVILSD